MCDIDGFEFCGAIFIEGICFWSFGDDTSLNTRKERISTARGVFFRVGSTYFSRSISWDCRVAKNMTQLDGTIAISGGGV